ncbi:MAG: hypothetical protein ACLQBK_11945 [Candidatus Sulfotelmatobacter sp.]
MALFSRDDDPDRAAPFLDVPNKLPDVALGDARFVFVIDDQTWLQRSAAGIAVRQDVIATACQLLTYVNTSPCPRLFRKTNLLPLANTSYFRHLGFQLVVPFTKFRDFSQTVFDPSGEVIPVGLSRTQFILVALPDLGGSLRQFGLEARPSDLVVVCVLLLKQAESFLSAELSHAGKVFDPKAIQNLGSLECAFPQTEWAFDGLVHRGRLSGHANLMALHFVPHV